jgi:hypothetical protein
MLSLPDQRILVRIVSDALEDVRPTLCNKSAGWADVIGDAIKRRLENLDTRIECSYGHGHPNSDENEQLFDFSALLYDPPDRKVERYLTQALIIGEIECWNGLDKDFDKLLVVDSLVCFFAFPDSIVDPRHPEGELDFFYKVAESRRQRAAQRAMMPPPAFILARYSNSLGTFTYRFAADPAVLPN